MSRTIPAAVLSFLVGVGGMHAASLVSGSDRPPPDAKATEDAQKEKDKQKDKEHTMKDEPKEADRLRLGNFSVSLTVRDLAASRAFYEKLGFKAFGGDEAQNWLIMQNESATIGLFQGMFPKNMLTFNPGWDRRAKALDEFDDVREIQSELIARGVAPMQRVDEASTGPGSIMVIDPDGNPILIDQHVPKRQ